MDDAIVSTVLVFVVLIIFSVGIAVGNNAISKDIRESLCKQLNTETTNYLACKENS